MADENKIAACVDKVVGKDANFAGQQAVTDIKSACAALGDERYGYAALEMLKGVFVDTTRHQFSAGDEAPKPLETPTVQTASAKTPEVKTR